MISSTALTCRNCAQQRYPIVKAIGGEFAFECPCCGALHLFFESIHFDLEEHFADPRWSRYVGFYYKNKMYPAGGVGEVDARRFARLLRRYSANSGSLEIVKLSEKYDNGKYFVASMLHDHFQEAFRAVYHMQARVASNTDEYKILIVPNDGRFDFLLEEASKLKGVDEVWIIPFETRQRWPFANSPDDVESSWVLSNTLQKEFDRRDGIATIISKRAGAVPNGKQILRNLLEPLNPKPLYDVDQNLLTDRYLAILVKQDSSDRAGLYSRRQFKKIAEYSRTIGLLPLIVATGMREALKVKSFGLDIPIVFVPTIAEQAQLFRNNVAFVIGTNCSGCNIPCLYDLPLIAFAKERTFPDDFYCFARMASRYDKNAPPWYGNLEKADSVLEIEVPKEQKINIEDYHDQILDWLIKYAKVPSHKYQGRTVIEEGYHSDCPQCGNRNRSNERMFIGSDIYYRYICRCGVDYVEHYGLTTSSLVETKQTCEVQKFQEAKRLAETAVPEGVTVEMINKSQKEPLFFYAIKPSLGDLGYVLPCLLQLRADYKDRKIIAITHRCYRNLIPQELVDGYWLLEGESPYQYHTSVYSSQHKYLQRHTKQYPVVSNYPGNLPATRNNYYALRKIFERTAVFRTDLVKLVDVTICCRLMNNRQWPSIERIREITNSLDQQGVSYYILVFPKNEKEVLRPEWYAIENVIVNPSLKVQIELAKQTYVWVAPHGASGVVPSLTHTCLVELETDPPWWRDYEPQPLRFGLPRQKFRKLTASTLDKISTDTIIVAIKELLNV